MQMLIPCCEDVLKGNLKRCRSCKAIKDIEEFSRNRTRKDGRNFLCKACHHELNMARRPTARVYNQEYRKQHKEKLQKKALEYAEKNKEKLTKYRREWYCRNKERHAAIAKMWALQNRDKTRAMQARYRASKRKAPGFDYTKYDHIVNRWEMWGGRCYICSDIADQTDHVKPLNQGGSHWPSNLRPICSRCNQIKHDKWLGAEFIQNLCGEIKCRKNLMM